MWDFSFSLHATSKTHCKIYVSDDRFNVSNVCSSMAIFYNAPFMIVVCQTRKFQYPSTNRILHEEVKRFKKKIS